MDINNELVVIKGKAEGLVANKVSRFAYTEDAYVTDDVTGVVNYDYEAEQNVPLETETDLNPSVISKGVRAQAASLPRGMINHFFGRLSYNLNKMTDFFDVVVSSVIRGLAQNGSAYSPTTAYLINDVCFFAYVEDGEKKTNYFMRTSSSPTELSNVPPMDANGNQNTAHWTIQNPACNKLHGVVGRPVGASNYLPATITTPSITISTASHPMYYYYKGQKVYVNADKTASLAGAAGIYFVYFDAATGNIVASVNAPGFGDTSNVVVATILWNGADLGLVADERHQYNRNKPWHNWAHLNIGCMYTSGLALSVSGTGASSTLSLGAGEISDEDILLAISPLTTCRQFWQTGAVTLVFDSIARSNPFKLGANNRPCYVRGDTYALVEMSNTPARFINVFFYATNDIGLPLSMVVETVPVAIHNSNGYTDLASARSAPWPVLSTYGVKREAKALYRVVISSTGVVQAMIASDDVRLAAAVPVGGVGGNISAASVSFSPTGNLLSTTVQNALSELDLIKASNVPTIARMKRTYQAFNTPGSFTYTPPVGCIAYLMVLVGACGGGGSAGWISTITFNAAGSGGSGALLVALKKKNIVPVSFTLPDGGSTAVATQRAATGADFLFDGFILGGGEGGGGAYGNVGPATAGVGGLLSGENADYDVILGRSGFSGGAPGVQCGVGSSGAGIAEAGKPARATGTTPGASDNLGHQELLLSSDFFKALSGATGIGLSTNNNAPGIIASVSVADTPMPLLKIGGGRGSCASGTSATSIGEKGSPAAAIFMEFY